MEQNTKRETDKEVNRTGAKRNLAKKRAQCLNEALCPARAEFSAGLTV
jgi:hypothetical protein